MEERSQLLEIWVYRDLGVIHRKARVKTLEIDTFVLGATFSDKEDKNLELCI